MELQFNTILVWWSGRYVIRVFDYNNIIKSMYSQYNIFINKII